VLGGFFSYVLYTEGAFDTKEDLPKLEPFEMKCESGKCGVGKCGGTK